MKGKKKQRSLEELRVEKLHANNESLKVKYYKVLLFRG